MSETLAVKLSGVGKLYKVFANRRDRLMDALGLAWILPPKPGTVREFWSLRDVDLDVPTGARIGIIGRNGAGKSTLLKLITGNIAPTEGSIDVHGTVQALFEAGAGFHPEFTGLENIKASLTYQGLSPQQIDAAIADIADFTELEQFLKQPLKTYSLGMQARLAFATATSVRPNILIVDEVLGAGDAYFATKSTARMRRLVEESGATVLLVSHALDQVQRYCDECIWLERGRVVQRGPTVDIIGAYEAFIHDLEDRHLRGKNRRRLAMRDTSANFGQADRFVVSLEWRGPAGTEVHVGEARLLHDSLSVETVAVGDVQDADPQHSAAVVLEDSRWSEPQRDGRQSFRALRPAEKSDTARGALSFQLIGGVEQGDYTLSLKYRQVGSGQLTSGVTLNGGVLVGRAEGPRATGDWREWMVPLGRLGPTATSTGSSTTDEATDGVRDSLAPQGDRAPGERALIRWPGEGSLRVSDLALTDGDDKPRAAFRVGEKLRVSFSVRAQRAGEFALIAGVTVHRLDGVLVTNLLADPQPLQLAEGEGTRVVAELAPLGLGDGHYSIGLSIFDGEVVVERRLDLLARCLEFKISGNLPLEAQAIFHHPSAWTFSHEPKR